MTLGLFCLECDRWGEIKPQSWLAEGKVWAISGGL